MRPDHVHDTHQAHQAHQAHHGTDEYRSCQRCGEYAQAALRTTRGGVCICLNCADAYHQHAVCTVCAREAASEQHHVATRRQSPLTIPVCLNCHAIFRAASISGVPPRRLGMWDHRNHAPSSISCKGCSMW